MITAPKLADETVRCEALHELKLLDTKSEERFDRLTRLAQRLFGVEIALVSLVDTDRQWFKSRQGLEAQQTPRSISFCGHAIAQTGSLVVENALEDERFSDNPLVTDAPHIRFYAGVPLKGPGGHLVGTLCIIDSQAREFGESDLDLLHDLGRMVEGELRRTSALDIESRRAAAQLWKPISNKLSSRKSAAAVALIAGVAIVFMAAKWDQEQRQTYRLQTEQSAQSALGLMRGELETALNAKLHLVYGLSGMVRSQDEIDQHRFEAFARQLSREVKNVRSLQLAPDGVVRFVWPLQSNASAIGHDLLEDEARRQAAQWAIDARKLWLAGPLNLIQGGQALIGRLPIFITEPNGLPERFWGFGTILLDLPGLLDEVGINRIEGYQFALRGRNATGENGATFFGDKALFGQQEMTATISLPAGSWQLAIRPDNGWPEGWPGRNSFAVGATCICLIIMTLVYFLLRLPNTLREVVERATRQMEAGNARFRDAIAALPAGFVIFDSHNRLVVCNEQFRNMYPATRPRLQPGRSFDEILNYGIESGQFLDISPGDTAGQAKFQREAEKRHQLSSAAYDLNLSDHRVIRVIEESMRDGGRVAFHLDVTEERTNEAALVDARQRAEKANQAKSTFLATISHEVRTPLNGVLGLLSVLRDDHSLGTAQAHYVKTAHESAEHLLTLLNEILDVSKMEAGKLELELADFILADTLHGAVDLVRSQAESKGLELSLDIDPELEKPLQGDEGRIRQIVLNLLSNAVKFTEKGQVRLVAKHSGRDFQDKCRIQICVHDTGIGFESELASDLFAPFSQLDDDADRRFSGTGLGLNICRRLVDLMGGEIIAQGAPGKGSSFHLEIALHSGQSTSALDTSNEPLAPIPAKIGWPTIRVLLAEDSPTNQLVIRAMLKDTGYVIDVVSNGLEAVSAVTDLHYDLVLMDVFMPEMNGIEATAKIRALPYRNDIPIIALTANAMDGDAERFANAGMDDYLPKPVERNQLLLALHRWVEAKLELKASEPTEALAENEFENIDHTILDKLKDDVGIEAYLTILEQFRQDIRKTGEQLKRLVKVRDGSELTELADLAHTLKSTSATVGLTALSQVAAFTEAAGRDANFQSADTGRIDLIRGCQLADKTLETIVSAR